MQVTIDLPDRSLKMLRAVLVVRKDSENVEVRSIMAEAATQLDRQLYPHLPAYLDEPITR